MPAGPSSHQTEMPAPGNGWSDEWELDPPSLPKSKKNPLSNEIAIHQAQVDDGIILVTARIDFVSKDGLEVNVRALSDNGSQVNLITQALVQQLNEKMIPEQTIFTGIDGNNFGHSLREIYLKFRLKKW